MKRTIKASPLVPHAVNLFLGMEAGNHGDLVTVARLDSATVGSGGAWSIDPSPLTTFTVTTGFDGGAFLRPITVAGTPYTGAGGTRGYAYNHLADDEYAIYAVTGGQKVSVGFWHQTDLHTNDGQSRSFDLCLLVGTGTTAVAAFNDATGTVNDGLWAHGSSVGAGSTVGVKIPTVANTKYWVTLQYDSVAGLCQLAVFNEWGVQVGATSSCAIDTGNPVTAIKLGSDNHLALVAKTTRFDGLIVDWTTGVFPLGV